MKTRVCHCTDLGIVFQDHRHTGPQKSQSMSFLLTKELGVSRALNIAVMTISWETSARVSSVTAARSLNYLTVLPRLSSGFPGVFLSQIASDPAF